jgi:hypothetical protein
MTSYRALGWPYPRWVVDLYAEFRTHTNGYRTGKALLDAIRYFGAAGIAADEKENYRRRIMAGGPFTAHERELILNYCQTDVEATRELFCRLIQPTATLTGALIRGEFTKVVADAEYIGIPLDGALYQRMVDHWDSLQSTIIDRVNALIPVFENRSFRIAKFESWLDCRGWLSAWPRTACGQIALMMILSGSRPVCIQNWSLCDR